jgi:hypothetical protein
MDKKQILNKKNYSKFDRQYMVFGSMANSIQGYVAKQDSDERVLEILRKVWGVASEVSWNFIDKLYETNEKEEDEDTIDI